MLTILGEWACLVYVIYIQKCQNLPDLRGHEFLINNRIQLLYAKNWFLSNLRYQQKIKFDKNSSQLGEIENIVCTV